LIGEDSDGLVECPTGCEDVVDAGDDAVRAAAQGLGDLIARGGAREERGVDRGVGVAQQRHQMGVRRGGLAHGQRVQHAG
jgi:hypothetical protein